MFMVNELANYFVHAQSNSWSISRISEFGFVRGNATKDELYFEVSMLNSTLGFDCRIYRHIFFACILCVHMSVSYDSYPCPLFWQFVNANTRNVGDSFRIIK